MPIRVTCPGCHTRFNVNDKFAGKEGPCPKCKNVILIPKEQVVIHAPQDQLPKDSKGRAIIDPIQRSETKLSSVQIALIAVSILGFFLGALVLKIMVEDKSAFPQVIVWLSALLLAPPIVYSGYTFLRDPELGRFFGRDLWARIGICSLVYALLWLIMPVSRMAFADNYELGSWSVALVAMLAFGGAISMLVLDLDYIMGLVHYGLYLGVCLLGRLIVGIGTLPGMLEQTPAPTTTAGFDSSLAEGFLLLLVNLVNC